MKGASLFEALERREMLSAVPPLPVFATGEFSVETGRSDASATLNIDRSHFQLTSGDVLVGIRAIATDDAGLFDPKAPTLKAQSNEPIKALYEFDNVGDTTDGLSIFNLTEDRYHLMLASESGYSGSASIQVSLLGDLDGDQDVDQSDRDHLVGLMRSRDYDSEADVNGDGRLTSFDFSMLRRNMGESIDLSTTDNQSPIAGSDTFAVYGLDHVELEGLYNNDSDPDLFESTRISTADRMTQLGARISVGPEGVFYYPSTSKKLANLPPGQTVEDSFTYTLSDKQGASDTAKVTINFTASLARNDEGHTSEDAPLFVSSELGVLANDGDLAVELENRNLTIIAADDLSSLGAKISMAADGSYLYDPTGVEVIRQLTHNGILTDSFTYTVRDQTSDATDEATVYVSIIGIAEGREDLYSFGESETFVATAPGVLANDGNEAKLVTTGELTSDLGVSVTLSPDGALTYHGPSSGKVDFIFAGESTTDWVDYEVEANGQTHTVRATFLITGENDVPSAGFAQAFTDADSEVEIDLLEFAYDKDHFDVLSVETIDFASASGVELELSSDGRTLKYDPTNTEALARLTEGEAFQDTFRYTIRDLAGATSEGLATLFVTGVNDAPLADFDEFFTDEDTPLEATTNAFNLLDNDSDIDGDDSDPLFNPEIQVTSFDALSLMGASVFILPNGTFSYDMGSSTEIDALQPGDSVTDSFNYTITDQGGLTAVGTAFIEIQGIADLTFQAMAETLASEEAPGVLTDAIAGSNVSAKCLSSNFGALVKISDDGSFSYDITGVDSKKLDELFNDFSLGDILYDHFQFDYTDGFGLPATQTVTIELTRSRVEAIKSAARRSVAFRAKSEITFDDLATVDDQSAAEAHILVNGKDRDPDHGQRVVYFDGGIDRSTNSAFVKVTIDGLSRTFTKQYPVGVPPIPYRVSYFGTDIVDSVIVRHLRKNDDLGLLSYFETKGGNDSIFVDDAFATIASGDGNDKITLDAKSRAWVHAGPGDDVVDGLTSGRYYGEEGDDTLKSYLGPHEGNFQLVMEGGPGNDTILSKAATGAQLDEFQRRYSESNPFRGGIEMRGGDGNDTITAYHQFALSHINGGAGDDVINGGPGKDYIITGPGRDVTNVGGGKDNTVADHLEGVDQTKYGTTDSVSGVGSDVQASIKELDRAGALMATLSGDKKTLRLAGPTGYGFDLVTPGAWQVVDNNGAETFRIDTNVALVTAVGNLPIPVTPLTALSFNTATDTQPNQGRVMGSNFTAFDFDVTGGLFKSFGDIGLSFSSLQSLDFSVKMGHEVGVDQLLKGVPYIVATSNALNNLVKFGTTSISATVGLDWTIAIDPTDPMVYFKSNVQGGSFAGGFAFSNKGQVVFRPVHPVPGMPNDGQLEGHLFWDGKVSLGIEPVDVSIEGQGLIDLDANNDGNLSLGTLPQKLGQVVNGQANVLELLDDVAVGFNGKINAEVPLTPAFGLTVPLSGGSIVYSKRVLGFVGGTIQPFTNTFLDFIEVPSSFVQGHYNFNRNEFSLAGEARNARIAGFELNGAAWNYEITNQRMAFGVGIRLFPVNANVSGAIEFNPFAIELQGRSSIDLDFGPFDASLGAEFSIAANRERFGIGAEFWARASLDIGVCDLFAELKAGVMYYVGPGGVDLTGHGRVVGGCGAIRIGLDAEFHTHGFKVDLPWPVPNIDVKW